MKNKIDRFRLEYDYLSNFYPVCVRVEGLEYLSAEAAYQAAKCARQEDRALFTELGSRDAKQLGRKLPLRADWEAVKVQEMEKIVRAKFAQNLHLARFLTETGDAELVEGNTWHDTFWGVDLKTGAGENHLGKILMALREDFQKNGLPEQDQPPCFRCETSEDGIQVQLRDITQIPCDCIVNATDETLLGSGEVNMAIHRAAGTQLLEVCRALGGCCTTEAKLTGGYRLAARWIIHTVGPRYPMPGHTELLVQTYQNVLNLAKEHGLHSIAFPAISTGRFSYPKAEAAAVAVDAVRRWKREHSDYALEIIFADMDLVTYRCFCKAFKTKENSQ